jgi:Tfp pilus assembly protein PilV
MLKAIFLIGIGVLSTTATQAQQRSPALAAYQQKIQAIFQMVGEAMEAQQCGLRSHAWLNSILVGTDSYVSTDPELKRLSPAEQEAVSRFAHETLAKAAAPIDADYQGVCSRLANSKRMDQLDRFQDHLTGGYH